jgi:hypothetical protein
MNFVVWHVNEPTFGLGEQYEFPKDYSRVAVVKSDNVDDVFRITNHIESDWTQNPEVVTLIGNRHRSTSVGDVVEEFKPDGKKFLCAPVGWKEIA